MHLVNFFDLMVFNLQVLKDCCHGKQFHCRAMGKFLKLWCSPRKNIVVRWLEEKLGCLTLYLVFSYPLPLNAQGGFGKGNCRWS